jgi:formate dehydrogenase major subunit
VPELSRRDFFKLSGAGAGGAVLTAIGTGAVAAQGPERLRLHKRIGETASMCAFCAGGCGVLVAADGKKVVSLEGDPDHPINEGALCSKAQALYQIRTVDGKDNPLRVTTVRYRAPGATAWQDKDWDWAITEIAKRIKATRDKSWMATDATGATVNRTEALANLGGAALDNEECYVLAKMARALGIVYLEHQARI